MTVAILVPMLGRPHHIAPLLDSIRATTDGARVVFLCSPPDAEVHAEIDAAGEQRIMIDGPMPGDYARKINVGVAATDEPLIFTGASDIRFHDGWLEAACAQLADGIGVVGTNDLGSQRVMAGVHSTHSLVTRSYAELGTIDEPGKLLHEGYPHEFVDDELVATAKHRNAWAFAADSIVEHLHPSWGKAPTDATYDEQGHRMWQGRRIYRRRMRLWT